MAKEDEDGVWRTIAGHRVFITKDGTIHSKNSNLDGKKLSSEGQKIVQKDQKRDGDISFTSNITKKELSEKYNITASEQSAIDSYTGGGYYEMNKALRENFGEVDKCSREIQEKCKKLDQVLDKLPKYEGVVVRRESGDRGDYYIEGRTYTNTGYTSTTAWTDIGGTVKLEIEQSSGCNISKLSISPGENEVLLPRGFTYKITKVEKTESGYVKVYAKEVKNGTSNK